MIVNKKLYCLLVLICCLAALQANSQNLKQEKPKIYLLIDTAAVPTRDQLYKITRTNKYVAYEIFCPCFYKQQYPGFISHDKPAALSKKNIKDLPYISLKEFLLKVCKEQEGIALRNDIYIVEKVKNKYYIYSVIMNSISREE